MLPPRTNAGVKQMNATISPGADSAFAATIRSCTKKPSRFARPYARRLWTWLRNQGAGVIDLGVLGRGRMVYEFEPDGPFVKLIIRELSDEDLQDMETAKEALATGVLDPSGLEHAECIALLGLEVQP